MGQMPRVKKTEKWEYLRSEGEKIIVGSMRWN
jgi:hypothetical protein